MGSDRRPEPGHVGARGNSRTYAEIERLVTREAARHAGKIIGVIELGGYVDGQSISVLLSEPIRARVLRDDSSVVRWTSESWCDPIYEVELLDDIAELAELTSPWVYATSYSTDGRTEPAQFVVDLDVTW